MSEHLHTFKCLWLHNNLSFYESAATSYRKSSSKRKIIFLLMSFQINFHFPSEYQLFPLIHKVLDISNKPIILNRIKSQ